MKRTFILNVFILLSFIGCVENASAQHQFVLIHDSMPKSQKEAILILPGFGSKVYGIKKIAAYFKRSGYDLYIPKYISRKSVEKSVETLDHFVMNHGLKEYKKLHVLAYIFGSWTINSWITKHGKCNISTIIYDRSPLQERAPAALVEDSPVLSKILFGNAMKDFCTTPYISMNDSSIYKGIMIETYATHLIYKHQKTALKSGTVKWDPVSLNQQFQDYCYLPLNHDEMYKKLDIFGNEVINFITLHAFSKEIKKHTIIENPFIKFAKK